MKKEYKDESRYTDLFPTISKEKQENLQAF